MKALGAALAGVAAAALGASLVVSRPLFDERLDRMTLEFVSIAPLEEALSFARYRAADGSLRLLLVTQFRQGRVTGFDVEAEGGVAEPDPIALYRTFGYETLAELGRAGLAPATVDVASLELPFPAREHNIGIGANFREHAREASVDEQPFVFPKLALPTPHSSDIARLDATLLDYEAELGLVLLDDYAGGLAPLPRLGLVLANEVTDRWALVRNLDRDGTMGTTGFADGKSREGFAPIGPLLVIPRDFAAFYPRIELRLHLNGRLRQRDRAGNMTWAPPEILRQIFARVNLPYRYRDADVALLPGRRLPAGSIVFSGTPAGVIFKPLNLWNPWVYLRAGDEVVVTGDFLGTIRNRIR